MLCVFQYVSSLSSSLSFGLGRGPEEWLRLGCPAPGSMPLASDRSWRYCGASLCGWRSSSLLVIMISGRLWCSCISKETFPDLRRPLPSTSLMSKCDLQGLLKGELQEEMGTSVKEVTFSWRLWAPAFLALHWWLRSLCAWFCLLPPDLFSHFFSLPLSPLLLEWGEGVT